MPANTNFSPLTPLSAAQANNFPRGVMGLQTLTAAFGTSAVHTTLQDNGATLTITEASGRIYRVTYAGFPYPNGGMQAIGYSLRRSGAQIKDWFFPIAALETANGFPYTMSYVYTSSTNGSITWKIQMAAATANTQVSDFGSATFPRQFWIEDIGGA